MKRDARKGRGGDGFGCETAARGPSASFLRNWFFWSNHKVRRYTIGKQSDGIEKTKISYSTLKPVFSISGMELELVKSIRTL